MHSLPLFIKVAGQPVILIGSGEAAEAKRRLIERAGGIVVGEENDCARIAFIALPDSEGAAAAERLKARGMLVNVVDMPHLCDFTTPAIVDRDPVLVAVSSGGASAGLAASLRQRLEDVLPLHLGRLARDLSAARAALRSKWPESGSRRRALGRALRTGGAIDPLGPEPDVAAWLAAPADRAAGQIARISLRSDDPDDLTVRDARLLGMADCIAHEPGVPAAILNRARADAERLALAAPEHFAPGPGLTVIIRWDRPHAT